MKGATIERLEQLELLEPLELLYLMLKATGVHSVCQTSETMKVIRSTDRSAKRRSALMAGVSNHWNVAKRWNYWKVWNGPIPVILSR